MFVHRWRDLWPRSGQDDIFFRSDCGIFMGMQGCREGRLLFFKE
jgi:hypothetical protein